ncbi:hypothetical protein BDQ12DRAFT_692097 [Crucibulum laeve]|uniref:Uncharacterized protein n=1 Tax=Crucibulum laeve TaxID=68775 RepID=A0A5C3LLD6_9AGAR|nr:hypothetical protein BDQ12DRAFT_692097 [Crucibulum laeve]
MLAYSDRKHITFPFHLSFVLFLSSVLTAYLSFYLSLAGPKFHLPNGLILLYASPAQFQFAIRTDADVRSPEGS